MMKVMWMRAGAMALAAALAAGPALAQEIAPDAPPAAPAAPPPVQAAPDTGPPPADAPAAQSPSEMPVDEGTVNDLSNGSAPSGGAPAATPAPPPPAGTPAPAAPPAASPSEDSAAAAPAADDLASKVAAFDPYVEDMQVVGPWTEGDAAGIWRTVMVREADDPEAYRFFIQSVTDQGGTLVVRDTTEITELATIEGGIVGYRADEDGEDTSDGLTLFFDIVPADGEISETYELHFFGAGQPYQFGPASN